METLGPKYFISSLFIKGRKLEEGKIILPIPNRTFENISPDSTTLRKKSPSQMPEIVTFI